MLALDVGTSSVRAAVDGGAGELVQTPYPLGAGRVDAKELAETCLAAIEAAGPADEVAISCFWHSLVALDENGEPLTPVLTWSDLPAPAPAEPPPALLGGSVDPTPRSDAPPDAFERTGCPPHPSFWPAKLARLRTEQPDVFARAARFAGFGDYLFARLTGELRTSLCMASGTGVLDLRAGGWDDELLAALGVERERLPPLGDEPVGGVHPPLGDGACSNLGAGCTGPGTAALMVGTSGALRLVRPLEDAPPPRRGLFRYLLDARRAVEGGSLSDGGNLHAWLRRTLRDVDTAGIAGREPDGHGLTFLPLLGGERSPGWDGSRRGAVAGLSFATTPEDLVQAATEGLAYRFAAILELMPEVERLVATGHALLRDRDLLQILADVLGREIAVSSVPEASLRGAALAARGEEDEAPPTAGTVAPRLGRTEVYRRARIRQQRLYEGAP